jgi:hypothetical protein
MNTSKVTLINPGNNSALNRFVSLERKLMKGYALYMSEIDVDVMKFQAQKLAGASFIVFFAAAENCGQV